MKIYARSGCKGTKSLVDDFDPPFDDAGDKCVDQEAILRRLFCRVLRLVFSKAFAGEDDKPTPGAVSEHLRDKAFADLRHEIVCLHLAAIQQRESLSGEIHHDGAVEDSGHLAEHLFAHVKGGSFMGTMLAVLALFLLFLAASAFLLHFAIGGRLS